MDALVELEAGLVAWLNQGVGRFTLLDQITYLLVSDYFLPLLMCFWGVGLWFRGSDTLTRSKNQKAVLASAISLGFANLAVLVLNLFIFRDRPLVDYELSNLLYPPTDSSFPANPAALSFAFATALWLGNRRAAAVPFILAGLWSFTRLYNGLFYPSDVVAGGLIGVAVACLVTLAMAPIGPLIDRLLRGVRVLHLA